MSIANLAAAGAIHGKGSGEFLTWPPITPTMRRSPRIETFAAPQLIT